MLDILGLSGGALLMLIIALVAGEWAAAVLFAVAVPIGVALTIHQRRKARSISCRIASKVEAQRG